MKRAIAVLAGLIAIFILSTATDPIMHRSGVFPPMGQPVSAALWWLAIGYRFAYTFLGGWISARLDPQPGMRATWILAGPLACWLGGTYYHNPKQTEAL